MLECFPERSSPPAFFVSGSERPWEQNEPGCSPVNVIDGLPARWRQRQMILGKRPSTVGPDRKSWGQPNGMLFAGSLSHLLFAVPAGE